MRVHEDVEGVVAADGRERHYECVAARSEPNKVAIAPDEPILRLLASRFGNLFAAACTQTTFTC